MDESSAQVVGVGTDLSRTERQFEFSTTMTPSVAVVETVADETASDPRQGPPLHEAVDTEALNELLTKSSGNLDAMTVSFEYDDYEVTVSGDGTVTLDPLDLTEA
ncbi:MAG: HalOD1 output domain-containing protein [archaeon]